MLFTLIDYLTKNTKRIDRVRYFITDEISYRIPNGTLTGIVGMANESKIDIGIYKLLMDDVSTDSVDFAFPFDLDTATFMSYEISPVQLRFRPPSKIIF